MRRALALFVLPMFALAACGDDDDTAGSSSTVDTSVPADGSSTTVGDVTDSVPQDTAPTEDTTPTQDSMPLDTTADSLADETAACADAAETAVDAVEAALGEVAAMTAEDVAGSDVTVTMQDEIDAAMASSIDAGCDEAEVQTMFCDGLAAMTPDGGAAEVVLDGAMADCEA